MQATPGYVPVIDRDLVNLGYSRRRVYFVPSSQLKNYVPGDSDATKLSAINNNTNLVKQIGRDFPKVLIELDNTGLAPGDGWPLQLAQLDTDSFYSSSGAVPLRLKGTLKQPRGTYTSQADADAATAGRVPAKTVIDLQRSWGASSGVTLSTVIFGPNSSVPWYRPAQGATKAVLASAATMVGMKTGDIGWVGSDDTYDYSTRAGYPSGVRKAQKVHVQGVGVDVANYTIAAASSANVSAGGSSLVYDGTSARGNGMESRMVKGLTSGTTALVQGDTGNSQLLFQQIPSAFQVGETLQDVATGQSIGTVGAQYLIFNGKLAATYGTNPIFRTVPSHLPTVIDVTVVADGNPDDVVPPYNRAPAMAFMGTYDNSIKVKIKTGYQRGPIFTSCFRGVVDAQVSGLPNHALENEASQDAYGYGAGTFGCTEDLLFNMDAENVRHGFSSNVNGASEQRKWGTTRNIVVQGVAKATFGAGFDLHEGAEGVIFQNFKVFAPFWAGRALSAGVGINTRGFNTIIRDGYIEDVVDGILDSSQSTPAGIPRSDTRVINVIVNRHARYGYAMNDNTTNASTGTARTYIDSCIFRGDSDIPTSQYYQAGIMTYNGYLKTRNVTIENQNGCMILAKGESTNKRGGVGIHIAPMFDFTEGTANSAVRYECHMDTAAVLDPIVLANGTNRPGSIFRHEITAPSSGSPTDVQYQGIKIVQTSATAAAPTLNLLNVAGGTATATRLADPGEPSGGSTPANRLLPAGGTAGQVLGKLSATDYDDGWLDTGVQVAQFTASGTWTKPSRGTIARVVCVGGGHGGGGGGRNASGTAVGGGGGGSTASVVTNQFQLSDLGASETVTVGTGGAGGAGATANGGTGSSGTAGTLTQFGSRLRASGGNPGVGGGTAAGAGGTGQNAALNQASSFAGGAGGLSAVGANASGLASGAGSGGGGGGCSTTAGFAGGIGTAPGYSGTSTAGGASGGGAGNTGTTGIGLTDTFGGGGSGGGGNFSGAGGNGGNGGFPGGAGGGGGAGVGANGGKGGDGAGGVCYVIVS